MAEENQATKEPQQVTKEPQRVTTKNPKKVEVGKRLAAHNHKKREEQRKEQVQLEKRRVNQYYGIGAVLALAVIGGLGYYIYRTKKGEVPNRALQVPTPQNPPQQPHPQAQPQTNKSEMDLIYSVL